jgi:hypothetical protein
MQKAGFLLYLWFIKFNGSAMFSGLLKFLSAMLDSMKHLFFSKPFSWAVLSTSLDEHGFKFVIWPICRLNSEPLDTTGLLLTLFEDSDGENGPNNLKAFWFESLGLRGPLSCCTAFIPKHMKLMIQALLTIVPSTVHYLLYSC